MTTSLPTIQNVVPADVIDLGLGDPQLSLLPLDLIREASQARLSQSDSSFLQYGIEQGDGYFRLALAEFLSRGYGFATDPENLFVTSGISNGLDLLCTLFTKSGDAIFVEEPSYFLALKIFADHNLQVIPVSTDENGLVIEALEEKLKCHRPKFLYTIPVHQNPTGHTLTEPRRARLIELARGSGFLILADEVYQLLNYSGNPPMPFAVHADTGNVISLGSFSKILAPGLRLGWIQSSPDIIGRLTTSGLLDSGGGLNPFTSAIVREILESGGLEKNVNKLVGIYRSQLHTMDTALRRHLPDVEYSVPRGGYFFWLRLPEAVDAAELRAQAQAFKVDFRHGALFSSEGGLKNHIRLCFVHYKKAEIEEGIIRLKECLQNRLGSRM